MAKEAATKNGQLTVWMKFGFWIVGLVFTGGILYNTVSSQGGDIKENRIDIKAVKQEGRNERKEIKEDVHKIELNAKDIAAIAIKSAESTSLILTKITSMEKTLTGQATTQAVMSEKLKSLTKD
jgi:hypothetical protein